MKNPFKKTIEIHHSYDILPSFDWEQATSETATEYLKGLTRIQLLELEDREIVPDHLWDEYYRRLDDFKIWPKDEEIHKLMNSILQEWGGDKSLECQVEELKKRVAGIQKKLDKALKIIESTEVTMSAKTALSM